ncbi:unnamed protein product [Schistosoma turkestanicum]|nr:unnamed protein product [Schistosoma turkestanicum]
MSSAHRVSGKLRRSGSRDSQNSNKYSTPSSQSEVTRSKEEDTNCRTPESKKNGKHTKSSNREIDHDSQSGRSSLSFAVRRSGLSNKLPHTAHFEHNNPNDQNDIECLSYDIKSGSPNADCKDNQESRTKISALPKSSSNSRCTPLTHNDDSSCDYKNTKSPYKKCMKIDTCVRTPTNIRECEKLKSSVDVANHTPSNPINKSPSNKYSVSGEHNSDAHLSHSKKHTSYSDQNRNRVGSNTLVAYNSTDDEVPHGNKEHSNRKQKVRRKVGDRLQSKDLSLSETRPSNLSTSANQLTPGKTNSVKVIKGTARSTWDSSDSDFDSSVVHTEKASENEHTTSPDNQEKSNSLESSLKTSHSSINKSSLSKAAKSNLNTKNKNHRHQDGSSKCDPVNSNESRSKLSSRDSHHRRRRKNSDRQHSTSRRQRKSISSGGSDGSQCRKNRGTSRTKSTIEVATPKSRKRLRSHRSSSYRSSVSRSRYSSCSESSHKYDRHKRSYMKSKSYSSGSSARTSRSFRSSYSSRSSSIRTPRRHRRVRSFYRRRHRRRSYSHRSRSLSRSWHSTDSSFSSRSSLSSRSRYFSRRNTSKNRSVSRRSRSPLYRPTSSITKVPEDNIRTPPEHRLARLGVGPLSKDSVSDGRTNSPYSDPKSMSYIPSVNETVSAAVNRVMSGGQSICRKSSHESTATNNNNDSDSLKPIHDSKSSIGRNSDLHSQPPASSVVVQSNNRTSSPSVLVDIPLPQDALNQTTDDPDNKSQTNKSVPYIGPQVPPELAKRFGLSVADTPTKSDVGDPLTSVPSGNYVEITSSSVPLHTTPNSSSDTNAVASGVKSSNAAEVTSFNPPEFTIPPEQAELYRPLQEQAKEHALRRSRILMPDESKLNQIPSEFNFLQHQQQVQRQLALLQQQQSQTSMVFTPSNVVYCTPSILPLYAANTPLISTIPSVSMANPGNITVTETTVPQQVSAEAIILKQQQLQQQQQLSALCGAAYQQQTSGNDASQLYFASLSNPHITSNLTVEQQPNTSSSSNVKSEVNQLSTSLQQAQLQQLIAAAALQSVVQANNNNILSSANTIQSINHQQLLNQLIAQQQSQLSGFNIAPNLVTASLLAAQHQQKQLVAQWQKRALALAAASSANDQLKSAQERRLPVLTPGTTIPANLAVATPTSLASVLNTTNSLPAALQLGLLRSGLNPSILSTGAVNPSTQNQVASMAAMLAAAQQHQQQQQQCQQATALSTAQQSLSTGSSQFPVSSANSEFSNAVVQSASFPQQLQQRLLSLQASILHQKQQQQQQQQLASMNNAAAAMAATSGNAALLQAVIASSQQQQQLQQQRQQQIVQSQFQQQQQAVLAAILAAQKQQVTQDRLNKQM